MTLITLRLTQLHLGTREAVGSKRGQPDIQHIIYRVSLVKEKYGLNTVFCNIPNGMKMKGFL
uniref:Uncharacterized protein n=1 Tax=Arion vulgaris TaxID=1028688 RepID=A0A0B7B4H1_9EUPU